MHTSVYVYRLFLFWLMYSYILLGECCLKYLYICKFMHSDYWYVHDFLKVFIC